MPLSMILPDEGMYHLSSSPTIVLFPLPLAPTKAVVLPAGIERLKSRRTDTPRRDGYAKDKFVISILPSQLFNGGICPDSSSGSSSDFLSMMLKSSDAAPAALVNAVICGAIVEAEVAAISAAKTTLQKFVSPGRPICKQKAYTHVNTSPAFAISPLWNILNPCQKQRAIPA